MPEMVLRLERTAPDAVLVEVKDEGSKSFKFLGVASEAQARGALEGLRMRADDAAAIVAGLVVREPWDFNCRELFKEHSEFLAWQDGVMKEGSPATA